MSDPVFPDHLVDLQRASTAAWVEVEQHRKTVDAKRRREAAGGVVDEHRPWGSVPLRPWTDAEDARHAELLDAARAAAEELRQGIRDAGLDGGYTVTQGLKDAARA